LPYGFGQLPHGFQQSIRVAIHIRLDRSVSPAVQSEKCERSLAMIIVHPVEIRRKVNGIDFSSCPSRRWNCVE
jgi:hypothetical protein